MKLFFRPKVVNMTISYGLTNKAFKIKSLQVGIGTAGGSSQTPTGAGRGFPAAPPLTPVPWALSAGIGRTGCFIATSICCQQLRHEGVVDILKTTCQLRQDRSAEGGAHGELGSGGEGSRESLTCA